jgi:hypothetical protein
MGLFNIEETHIKQLDAKNLVRVLRKLLTLEANKFNIPQSAANVYLNINDPDGGEDGRIKWENGPSKTVWIPNRFTMFQSKAQLLDPNDCVKEILSSKTEIKPKVKEVLDAEGSYIFFCNRAYNPKSIDLRKNKVVDVLVSRGYPRAVEGQIEFYDGNKISNWVNQYLSAQVLVMELLGRHPLSGLQTWEKWDAKFADKKYFGSDKLNGWIDEIRKKLTGSQKNIIRITGLSGLGKTRLALEALKPPDDKNNIEQAGISDSVVYYEASSNESPIRQFITDYRSNKNVTFVIDECSTVLHANIKHDVLAEDSNINLITICNEPDDNVTIEQGENVKTKISLAPEDFRSVVKDMLNDTYKGKLPDNDISKIAEFAGGFPVIAVELANNRWSGSAILEPTDDNLVRKILWGQKNEDTKQLAVLQACSIFKHFKLEDESGNIDEQAKFICDVVIINDEIKGQHNFFCSTIKEFDKRKIIQKFGRYYSIEPVPLALQLSKQWWEHAILIKIKEIIEKVESKGLLESFCEQSRRFDCISQAADLIEKLCGPSCPFGNAEVVLSVAGSRIFRSFAEVNPMPVTDCLFRILTSPGVKVVNIVDGVRRNLVWALERLCWHEETFDKAATMLKILALAENEKWSNNSTGLFLQLFHIGLPGTKANLSQRQEIINNMINSGDIEQNKLAIKAIKNVFQYGHFSRGGGVESQGTKAPERDYYPTRKVEVDKYWKTNLEILTNLITSGGAVADEAKNTFADIAGSLIRYGYISDVENSVNKILKTGIFWHEMLVKIDKLLIREDNKFDDDTIKRLQTLSSSLKPRAWPDKVKHYISIPDWLHLKGKDGHYINLSDEKAEHLADELSESDELWNLLPLLYEGEQRQGFTFGRRLANKLKNVTRFINESIIALGKCQNPNMSVLGGFLSVPDNSAVSLQAMVELSKSEKLIRQIPSFLQYIRSSKECLDFTLKLLKENKLTIDDLVILRHGSPLGILEPKEAMSFCEDLANYGINGAKLALEILYMYCFGTPDRFEHCKKLLIALISKENILSGDVGTLDIYNWSELVKKYIPELPAEFSEHICKELIAFCSSGISNKLGALDELRNIIVVLFNNHYKIAWFYFGNALLEKSNWETKFGVEHLLGVEVGFVNKTNEIPLVHIPYDYLQSWCQQHAPEGPATIIRLLPVVWEENDNSYGIDELSRKLLLDFGNYEEVRHAATSQLFSFASCGSREPYYLRRIDVLKDFKKSTNNKVLKNWIDAIIISLEKEAQESKTEHDEFEAGIFDR